MSASFPQHLRPAIDSLHYQIIMFKGLSTLRAKERKAAGPTEGDKKLQAYLSKYTSAPGSCLTFEIDATCFSALQLWLCVSSCMIPLSLAFLLSITSQGSLLRALDDSSLPGHTEM